jgi:hypothetical protein
MMKNLVMISVFFYVVGVFAQKIPESRTKIVVASYDGASNGTYSFKNSSNDTELKFTGIQETAAKKFNLTDTQHIGMIFKVTYQIDFHLSTEKKREDKMAGTQSPYKRTLTIIDLEMLDNLDDEDGDDIEDDGK